MLTQIKKRLQSLSFFEIFISISIITLVVFVVKYFGLKVEWRTIRVEVINKSWAENYNPYGYRTPFWLSNKIKIGQKEYGKSGVVIAEIIGVDNYVRGGEEAEVYLTVKIRTTYQKALHQYYFKDKPLDLGSAIEIAPDQNKIYGQIVDTNFPQQGYPQKTLIVTVRGRGVDENIISKVKVDETMYERYKQKEIAKILDFHTEKSSRVFVNEITENNKSLKFNISPSSKDIILKLQMVVSQIDNRWYFAGHQNIMIGNPLFFYSHNINLFNLEIENVEQL